VSNLGAAIALIGLRVGVLGFGGIALASFGFAGCWVSRAKVFSRPVFNLEETTAQGAFRLMALMVIPGGAMVVAGLATVGLGAAVYYSAALFT
jgi:hypothetical protein